MESPEILHNDIQPASMVVNRCVTFRHTAASLVVESRVQYHIRKHKLVVNPFVLGNPDYGQYLLVGKAAQGVVMDCPLSQSLHCLWTLQSYKAFFAQNS